MRSVSLLLLAALAGCAKASRDIAPYPVSAERYAAHDCEQLARERWQIQPRLDEVQRRLDAAAADDEVISGAGSEYARLSGEIDAIQRAATTGKCAD